MKTITLLGWIATMSVILTPVEASQLPFAIDQVQYHEIPREHQFDGTIEAINQTTVSAQTSGRVVEVLYDVDDYVTKGQVILRLYDADQRSSLQQAQAGLREAEALASEARTEFDRVEGVFEKKLVAKSALDKAEAALKAAQARLSAAQAKRNQAQEQLEHTVVRAPYSGIVTERHVELGEVANVGMSLMSGISLEELRVSVNVPQSQIEAVRAAGLAKILIKGKPAMISKQLTFYSYANPKSNSFKVRVILKVNEAGLYPGMFAKVSFVTGVERHLMVPLSAVAQRSELTGVYVINDSGRASLRQVRLGRRVADKVEVLAGLLDGELVALDSVAAGIYLKSHVKSESVGEQHE